MIDSNFLELLIKSVSLFKPEFILVATFLAAIIFDLIFRKSKNISGFIALAGFILTGYFLVQQSGISSQTFSGMLVVDPFGQFFKFLILISSFIIVVMSFSYDELYKNSRSTGEYFTLIIGMTFGMFLLSSATNLILIYVAIETMSISSYILTGYTKEVRRASEASLKYVIFGAISSGIMIYGISILYGLTGTLNLFEINTYLSHTPVNVLPLLLSALMIIAGIGYKISAVPFHFWTPDVYEGAPITVTAFLSVASKAAGFAILIRFLKVGFFDNGAIAHTGAWTLLNGIDWKFIIAILSVLTMTLGNFVAVWQTNMKRLLAYSSIAHAGYMLMGVVVMTDVGVTAILIYFVMYLIMNLGAFFVVMLLANKIGSEEIEDYTGIGYRAPLLGICMVIFLISLTGLPPTAGFIGKWYLFIAVLNAHYYWLAVVGVLNSVVSLYYYVKIFRNMFVKGVDLVQEPLKFSGSNIALTLLFAIPTLIFGMWFTPIVRWAEASVRIFLGS
jgi:NADH-quinone oxidoreductase subunit N